MAYRNGNYCAFYVHEPFNENNLNANSTHDFVTYNLLRAWKSQDTDFPFCDSHGKTYNVRDGSTWETLKQRLHERLSNSKNIILILSSITINSKALNEELDYGINRLGLPVVVIYREYSDKWNIANSTGINMDIQNLWNRVPILASAIRNKKIATLHIPLSKSIITSALSNSDFMLDSQKIGCYYY